MAEYVPAFAANAGSSTSYSEASQTPRPPSPQPSTSTGRCGSSCWEASISSGYDMPNVNKSIIQTHAKEETSKLLSPDETGSPSAHHVPTQNMLNKQENKYKFEAAESRLALTEFPKPSLNIPVHLHEETFASNMCGSFTCSKNALIALNIVYILVSFILIGVAAYSRVASIVTNLAIVGGIIACGVFLFMLSVMGLIGAVRHHQVLLFFYMVILFLLFIIQFSIACACLAVTSDQQHQLAMEGWKRAKVNIKVKAQTFFHCYGFEDQNLPPEDPLGGGVPYQKIPGCDIEGSNNCPTCWKILRNAIDSSLKICGGIGLFFSFTEVAAVVLTHRYRQLWLPFKERASLL